MRSVVQDASKAIRLEQRPHDNVKARNNLVSNSQRLQKIILYAAQPTKLRESETSMSV